jgi:EAL domain-containing protein (putative c-di-GMP-specific phosphodiesterase class I)
LRWNHPTRGLVAPGDFIVAAEETGLIVPIGEWVLQRCCHDIRQWQREGISPLSIAINVSGRQLSQGSLVEDFVHVIRQAEVDPSFLEIELTESVAMEDGDATIEVFRQFKRHGIQVCIDDFGTGYSSLSYLKRFPIDKLKIDKSFVEFSPTDSDDQAIVETILAMAHSLKLAVVAEGVETTEQLRFLQSRNCDEWQGYLCSPPVPFDQLNGLIREGWHGSPV